MMADSAFKLGMHCVRGLPSKNLKKSLEELLKAEKFDISYPVLYERCDTGKWYLTVLRKDGQIAPPRGLNTTDKDYAVFLVRHLLKPEFDSRYVCDAEYPCKFTYEEREEVRGLRIYYPEIRHWSDFAIRYAWSMFSIVVHAMSRCKACDILEKFSRDDSFLDYLWHFKILGDGENFPYGLKNNLSKFLSEEVAIWRKWKKIPLVQVH